MKHRILKKYAKARHTYGFSLQGLKLEIEELKSDPFLMKKTTLRFWTKYWYRTRKAFKKHTGFSKKDYYDFYYVIPILEGKKIIQEHKIKKI